MEQHASSIAVRGLVCLGLLFFVQASPIASERNPAMQVSLAETSLLLDVAAAGSRWVAVGERGHILYSDDGETWRQTAVPVSAMLTRVVFASATHGWAVGHDGNVLFSRNGGVDWELQRDGVVAQVKVNEAQVSSNRDRVDSLRALSVSSPVDARAELLAELEEAQYQLEDALATVDAPVFPPPLMDVWFSNDSEGWASGAYGTLLRTSDGGDLWEDWSDKVDDPEQLHLNGVLVARDGTVILASEWGNVFRSTNGGETWQIVNTGYDGSFFGIVESPSTGSLFAFGLRGTIYRSGNSGLDWTRLSSGVSASLFGAHATPHGEVYFVGADGVVTRTADNGESFTPLTQDSRKGIYGIAPMGKGRYMLTGEGGSRSLRDTLSQTRLVDRTVREIQQ